MFNLIQRLRALLCRHSTVRVIRWHWKCVTPAMRGKELYVDRFKVHNFVQCCSCKRILNTDQAGERLFEQLLDH